jgi:hypothetical protein
MKPSKERRSLEMINNLPDYANEYTYVVATTVDGELWFYGAYNLRSKAFEAASACGGVIIVNEAEG